MLEATGLECVRGGRALFKALSLRAPPGTLLRIDGPNGSGKTSLLRILCGLLQPHAGEVRWQGTPVQRADDAFRADLHYLGHQNALKEDLSAIENLRAACALRGTPIAVDVARRNLETLGLANAADRPVRVLSQGQKRRAALSALYVGDAARLWLLDEPFVALDATAIERVATHIEAHVNRGGIVLYTTHQEVEFPTLRPLSIGLA